MPSKTYMASATLVPLSEYLSSVFCPDCDYLEGIFEERNGGEISHSEAQAALSVYARQNSHGFWTAFEVWVQVKPERFRVSDVVIIHGGKPARRVISQSAEATVEILSPEERAGRNPGQLSTADFGKRQYVEALKSGWDHTQKES